MKEKNQHQFNFLVASEGGLSGELLAEWAKGFTQITISLEIHGSLNQAVAAAEKASYDGLILSFSEDSERLRQQFLRHYEQLEHWCWLMIGPEIDQESWFYIQNGAQDYLSLSLLNQNRLEKGIALAMQRQTLYQSNQLLKADLSWRAQRYEALHETNPHGVVLSESRTGLILEANKAFGDITGWDKASTQAKTTLDLGIWARIEERGQYLDELTKQGFVRNKLALLRKRSGEKRHVLISGQIFNHRGQKLLLTIAEDHEMAYQTAKELKEREELYRSLVDQAPSLMFRLDGQGQFSFVGAGSEEYLNCRPEDLLASKIENLVLAKERGLLRECLDQVRQQRERVESPPLAMAAEYNNGAERFFRFYFWSIESSKGLIIQGLAQDVTEELARSSDLQSSYNESQLLLERMRHLESAINNHATVAFTDTDDTIKYVNDHFCTISGYTREELIGKNHRIVNSGLYGEDFWEAFWAKIKAGEIFQGEITNRRKDGSLFWVQATVVPRLNRMGQVVEFIVIRTDISDRKRTELALAKSQNLLRGVLDSVEDQIWAVDENMVLLQANRSYLDFMESEFGHKVALGTDMKAIFEIQRKRALNWQDRIKLGLMGQSEIYLDRLKRPSGSSLYLSSSVVPYFDDAQKLIGAVVRTANVSSARQQEKRLMQSEQLYRTITENIRDLIWTTDLDFKVNYISPNVKGVLGISASDFLTQPLAEYFSHTEDQAALNALVDEALSLLPEAENLRNKYWQSNLRAETKEAGKLTLSVQFKYLYNGAGQVIGFLGSSRDVTLREKAREDLQAALVKNENLLKALPDMVFILDSSLRFMDYRAAEDQTFLPPQFFLGKALAEVLPPAVSLSFQAAIAKISAPGAANVFEYSLEERGQLKYFECRVLLGADQKYYCIVRDITQR